MNKYLLFTVVALICLGADLYTKTLAEESLASASANYEHYIHLEVPEGGDVTTLEFLSGEFSMNSEEELRNIANQNTVVLNEDGIAVRRTSSDDLLHPGDRIEVRSRTVTLIEGFLSFRYVENRGAAWGFLAETPESFRQPFFIIVGILAIGFIFMLFRSIEPDKKFLVLALAFIVGGAVGNIVDRIRYGYVVDFILAEPGFEWPTFNVADALIVVGVGMMFIQAIIDHVRQRGDDADSEAAEAGA
jgi:lipoprotein signal peptidase